jgi:hypothetical protein
LLIILILIIIEFAIVLRATNLFALKNKWVLVLELLATLSMTLGMRDFGWSFCW